MNTDHYNAAIENVFDKLDARHRSLKSYDSSYRSWVISLVTPAACCVGLALFLGQPNADSRTVGSFVSALALTGCAMYLVGIASYKDTAGTFANKALGLVGRSLPLNEGQAQSLSTWSSENPRLVSMLGRWAATNPDGVLNTSDYLSVERAVKVVNGLNEKKEAFIKTTAILRSSGITAATNEHKLSKIASVHPRSALGSGKPSL